jgi:hypothetical protein
MAKDQDQVIAGQMKPIPAIGLLQGCLKLEDVYIGGLREWLAEESEKSAFGETSQGG